MSEMMLANQNCITLALIFLATSQSDGEAFTPTTILVISKSPSILFLLEAFKKASIGLLDVHQVMMHRANSTDGFAVALDQVDLLHRHRMPQQRTLLEPAGNRPFRHKAHHLNAAHPLQLCSATPLFL